MNELEEAEVRVTYPTAKLAHQKGFTGLSRHAYFNGDKEKDFWEKEGTPVLSQRRSPAYNFPDRYGYIPAPSQSGLQRWLREVHQLLVLVEWDTISFGYALYNLQASEAEFHTVRYERWASYEEALEQALLSALSFIHAPANG